ncbi:MAG: hypothetical protein HDR88_04895 [Bacteroides sp.]|nr:hypothetical protein [Bacteroides sp.]
MKKSFISVTATCAMIAVSATLSMPSFGAPKDYFSYNMKKTPVKVAMEAPATQADNLSDLPLISDTPEGTLEKYSKDAIYFGRDFYGQLYSSADFGRISEVVYADGGKVYFKNPFCGLQTDSWLEGTDNGETISVTFPQKIYSETYPDWENDPEGELMKTDNFYAFKLIYSNDGETSRMVMDLENPVITFSKTDSGIVMDGEDFIGLLMENVTTDETTGQQNSSVTWAGYADSGISLTTVDAVANQMPEGLEPEKWILSYDADYRFVDIAIDNNDIYIQGILSSMPEGVVKGHFADGKVVFEGVQYLGEDTGIGHFAFFVPAKVSINDDPEVFEEYIFYSLDSVTFNYEPEDKIIYTYEEEGMAFSSISNGIFLLEGYYMPQFNWQDSQSPMTPDDPEILGYEYYDDYEFGAIAYTIPEWSIDGRVMNTDNLFYNFFIDDQILVLYPDEYPDLDEPMENIPARYEDSSIYYWGDSYEAIIYPTGFDKIGVRTFYINPDGSKTYSNIVYNDGSVTSGIQSASDDMLSVTGIEYYTVDGRRIAKPAKGSICIKRTIFSDGSSKTTKLIQR